MSKALEMLKAILSEKLPDTEVQALIAELTIASGKGAVAIGGDASEAVIITGSQNIVGDNNRVVINQGTDPEELVKMLRSILWKMQQVYSAPELSPEELWAATLAFLQDIENKFKKTRLFHTKQPIVLKDQYVPIQVTLEPHKRDVETLRGYWETEEELKRAYALKGGEEKAEEELKRQQVDWQEAKQKHQQIMVLADPGMGKSTLLRMEAGITAQQELQKLQNHQTTIEQTALPLFLRLSELANKTEELIEAIPLLIQRDYPNTASLLLPLLTQKLKTGKCLLLLDALDEVPKVERNRVDLKEKLDRLMENYPCPVICTSRIVGYDGNFLDGGQEVEIVPFREPQIERYVTTWFRNVAGHLSDKSVSAAELMRELRNKPQVRGLVQNPLLLSLICSLYQEKGLTLPAHRVQVYEKAVKYMLEKWNKTRQSQFPGKTRAKIRLLEAFAYHFSCKNQEVFEIDDLYDWMEDYLDEQAPRDLKDAGTEALIAEFSEEDGILQKLNQDGDQYLFLHRTFQEYLTACYLKRAKDGIVLAKAHFWEYDWHETISLMAGLMKKPLPLLQAIMDEKDDIFQTQLLLSGRCLAECEESSHPLITKIIDCIYQFWLAYPDAEFIRSVVVAIGQRIDHMLQNLKKTFEHPDANLRRKATTILGEVATVKAINILNLVKNDHDELVRDGIVRALGKIGSTQAIDILFVFLNDSSSFVRQSVVAILSSIGNTQAINLLIVALNDTETHIKNLALYHLKRIKENRTIRVLCNKIKCSSGEPSKGIAISALIEILKFKDIEIINNVISELDISTKNYIISSCLSKSKVEIKFMATVTENSHKIQDLNTLIAALNYSDEAIYSSNGFEVTASEALKLIDSSQNLDLLFALLNYVEDKYSETDIVYEKFKELIRLIATKLPREKTIEALISTLKHEHWMPRSRSAIAIAELEEIKARDELLELLLYESDFSVRKCAIASINRVCNSETFKKIVQSKINIYDSLIFVLLRDLSIRFNNAKLPFIPMYPESIESLRSNLAIEEQV
jgi:HEAT repeat protein